MIHPVTGEGLPRLAQLRSRLALYQEELKASDFARALRKKT